MKKSNNNLIKQIKYFNLINYNLIYNNKAINRYKNTKFGLLSNKKENLAELKKTISCIKNCELKKNSTNIVFGDGNPDSRIMLIGEGPGWISHEPIGKLFTLPPSSPSPIRNSLNLNRNSPILEFLLVILNSTQTHNVSL